jgi:hypothetical protein
VPRDRIDSLPGDVQRTVAGQLLLIASRFAVQSLGGLMQNA